MSRYEYELRIGRVMVGGDGEIVGYGGYEGVARWQSRMVV